MFRSVLSRVLMLAVAAVLVLGVTSCDNLFGSDDDDDDDGTITVTFSDDASSAEEGNYLGALALKEGEELEQGADIYGGVFDLEIQNGEVTGKLNEWDDDAGETTEKELVVSGGDKVYFYAWTREDPGSPQAPLYETSFKIDGNKTIEVNASDFEE